MTHHSAQRERSGPPRNAGEAIWPLDINAPHVGVPGLSGRVRADPEQVEKGLVQLVLTLVELLRQLMEKQAVRRVEAGGLSDDEVERLGTTLMLLEQKMDELRDHFGLTVDDLNIDLGPLGRLL
jgi:hypothetical protein